MFFGCQGGRQASGIATYDMKVRKKCEYSLDEVQGQFMRVLSWNGPKMVHTLQRRCGICNALKLTNTNFSTALQNTAPVIAPQGAVFQLENLAWV
jgi:hypothetical protein